jgi:hypothetical protein
MQNQRNRRSPELDSSHPGRPTVKVVGTFRSGTNLLKYLLESTFFVHVVFSEHGWKHAPAPISFHKDRLIECPFSIIVMAKNPFHSFVSWGDYWLLRRSRFNPSSEISTFIREPLLVCDLTKPRSPSLKFRNAVDYWNQFYWSYLSICEPANPILCRRYEDLVSDPEEFLSDLAERLRLERLLGRGTVTLPKLRLATMNDGHIEYRDPQQLFRGHFDTEYIEGKQFLSSYSHADVDWINKELDRSVVSAIGYGT